MRIVSRLICAFCTMWLGAAGLCVALSERGPFGFVVLCLSMAAIAAALSLAFND
jgi:hypothetical protein